MIAFERVAVRYAGARANALEDVTFSVERGCVTAVVGPNGSGKSTLVRALLRRLALVSGSISVDGAAHATLGALEMARRVAVVPQREDSVFPMRVRDYVALGRHPHLGAWRGMNQRDRAATEAAAQRAGVEHLMDRFTDQISGGEWQLVRLARALAQEAAAIVLDEPTTFLDIAHEMSVFERLAALASEGHAVLVVSHQLNLVARFADTMVLLHGGRVAAAGGVGDVMRADVLESVYGWPLIVTRDPAIGAPSLTPLRVNPPSSAEAAYRQPRADSRRDYQKPPQTNAGG